MLILNAKIIQNIGGIDFRKALVNNAGHGKGSGIPGPLPSKETEGGKVAADAMFDIIDILDMKQHDSLLKEVKKLTVDSSIQKLINDKLEEFDKHIHNKDMNNSLDALEHLMQAIHQVAHDSGKYILRSRINKFHTDAYNKVQDDLR